MAETFGKRLKRKIADSGMTSREISKVAGISEVSISRYIHGTRTPNSKILKELSKALGTTVDSLLMTNDEEDFQEAYADVLRFVEENSKRMSKEQKKQLVNALF